MGLESREDQEYPVEFKLNVLNYMKITRFSYSTTANYFEISEIGTIVSWIWFFLKKDIKAVFKSKERAGNTMINQIYLKKQIFKSQTTTISR